MMNTPESAGDSSCKRQENGDASNGTDRPLKKARFAWQVKGKYHLKNDNPDSSTSASTNDHESPAPSSENDSNLGNTEQNLEILGDYLLKQDFNTLDSVITDSDKSLLQPSTSTEKLAYPRYVSSSEIPCTSRCELSKVAVSMVDIQEYKEAQCIARWQAKQMAKGFVDNTINRVLDSWMSTQTASARRDNNLVYVFDLAEFVDNIPDDNTINIENEGILMAISAHGLQNNSNSSSDVCGHSEMFPRNVTHKILQSQSRNPYQSDDDSESECAGNNKDDSWMRWEEKWHEVGSEDPNEPFQLIRDTSSPTPYDEHENSSITFADENASGNDILTNHYDFMDTAVAFAIQNKGLTSFGTDYG